jgi:DNA-binding SARP family transcriptional activator
MDMVFGILGPLQVWDRSRPVLARGTKRDVILGTLLLRANQLVAVDELAETLWAPPPASAVANIHTYVSGLRTSLPPLCGEPRIQRSRSGYLLSVEPGELDAAVFVRLVADAETTEPDRAAALLDARRAGRLRRIRLRREAGQHETAAAELRALLADDPFCEDLWRQLVLTLNAGGRQAAALRAYQQARSLLVAELGIEPGPALREAQATVLRGGAPADGSTAADRVAASLPALMVGPAAARAGQVELEPAVPGTWAPMAWAVPALAGGGPRPAMWQLPPDTPDFTGRSAAVAALTGWLAPTGGDAPPVAVVAGTPGVGKTTLAVRVAHLLRDRYRCDHIMGLAYGYSASGFVSAAAHWSQTPSQYKHSGDTNPPNGALAFFSTSGPYGHVAIVTAPGQLASNDIHGNGTFTYTTINEIRTRWGATYLGWTNPWFNH